MTITNGPPPVTENLPPSALKDRLTLTQTSVLSRNTPPKQGHSILIAILCALFVGALVFLVTTHYGVCSNTDDACTPGDDPDISKILLPFVVIATAIERFWETVFNWYESVAQTTAKLIGLSAETADWIKTEYGAAEDTVSHLVDVLKGQSPGTPAYDDAYALFQKAESRLQDAQTRLTEGLKAPAYVAVKQAITMIGSLVLGLVISLSAHLYLFHKAGFSIPGMADLVLTGLLIGAGPGPLHQVIGLLQGLRDSVGSLSSLAQGTAVKKAAEAIGQIEDTAAGRGTSAAPTPPGDNGNNPAPEDNQPPPPVATLPVQRQAQRLLGKGP